MRAMWLIMIFGLQLNAQNAWAGQKNNQTDSQNARRKMVALTLRFGQGGFTDHRSPLNQLGGGQIALDVKPAGLPIALSLSGEYYTNGPEPTHSYEISDLTSLNCLYVKNFSKTILFAGGGFGQLKVPRGKDKPNQTESGPLFNLEVGVNRVLLWKIGLYAVGKYLYAQKSRNGEKVIAFNEAILLIGLTLNFKI